GTDTSRIPASGSGVRARAALLLRAAFLRVARAGDGRLPVALWIGALDVRVAGPRALSVFTAARLGLHAASRLSRLGIRRDRRLPFVPLVRRVQGAQRGGVGPLRVKDRPLTRTQSARLPP